MKHVKTTTDTFLGLNLNEGKYTLFIINAREVMGHDDSLPYNANFELRNNDNNKVISGRVWNDGWGGCSNVELDNPKQQEGIDELNDYIKEHLHFYFNGYAYEMDFVLLVDNLAMLSIDCPSNNGKIFAEQAMVNYLKNR